MDRKGRVICSKVGFLGLLSAGLGFAAEAKRVKSSQIVFTPPNICANPGSASFGLAIIAAVAILIAQIIITTTTGSIFGRRYSYQSISWVTFVNAFYLFIRSAPFNARHTDIIKQEDGVCYILKPGYLVLAAVWALATAVLGILTYLAWDSAKNNDNGAVAAPNQGGIAV